MNKNSQTDIQELILEYNTSRIVFAEEEEEEEEEARLVVSLKDITERKLAEEALRQAEAKYRSIFDNAIDGIFQSTPEGKFLAANPAMARILGFTSPEELIRERTDIARQSYVQPERRDEFKRLLAEHGSVSGFEYEGYRKDGSTVWISETARAIRDADGRVVCYEGTLENITDRKRAEEALRESEERYRKLVELSPDAIYVHCEGKLVLANRAAVVLFGAADANELLGHNVLELVHLDSRTLMEEKMRKVQENNATRPAVEEKLLRLDGSSFDAEVSTAPFMFQGKPSALVVIRDITEKKALNEKLLRNQRLESIGTLAGGIAHDLNNVLAPILMSIEILRLKYPETDAERILGTIESSAQRGADLVKQVLTFSRGLQGERTPVQLRHVIREMQSIIRQTFPKSIILRTEMPQDMWTVNGDATQLHQVLMNLCVNARDAMPNGGTLSIKTEHLTLDESFARMNPEARLGPYVVLTVTDTGTGMPPEIRERIFEPFFTTKEQGKGTGLGLATVLGIAKGHGGFVTMFSEVGHGTKFKVYLPAQSSAETQRTDSERPPLPMGHGELILVADDEVAIQRIAQETLQMCGYTVVTVSNGAQAVAICALRAQELKLVITDMMMPIMDGPATVHALRVLAPNVKIIAASGLGSEVRETDPQKLGVDAFLRKPFTAETLLRTVGEVLGKG